VFLVAQKCPSAVAAPQLQLEADVTCYNNNNAEPQRQPEGRDMPAVLAVLQARQGVKKYHVTCQCRLCLMTSCGTMIITTIMDLRMVRNKDEMIDMMI